MNGGVKRRRRQTESRTLTTRHLSRASVSRTSASRRGWSGRRALRSMNPSPSTCPRSSSLCSWNCQLVAHDRRNGVTATSEREGRRSVSAWAGQGAGQGEASGHHSQGAGRAAASWLTDVRRQRVDQGRAPQGDGGDRPALGVAGHRVEEPAVPGGEGQDEQGAGPHGLHLGGIDARVQLNLGGGRLRVGEADTRRVLEAGQARRFGERRTGTNEQGTATHPCMRKAGAP